jgi:hypothetical protein
MPGVYKEKECPECGLRHRKRGIHCSQKCAQTGKTLSAEHKEKLSEKATEYKQTPEGIATTSMIVRGRERYLTNREKEKNGEYILTDDDWMIDLPTFSDDDDFRL